MAHHQGRAVATEFGKPSKFFLPKVSSTRPTAHRAPVPSTGLFLDRRSELACRLDAILLIVRSTCHATVEFDPCLKLNRAIVRRWACFDCAENLFATRRRRCRLQCPPLPRATAAHRPAAKADRCQRSVDTCPARPQCDRARETADRARATTTHALRFA